MAIGVVVARHPARSPAISGIAPNEQTTARLISTLVSDQQARQELLGTQLLSAATVSSTRFSTTVASLGGIAGVLVQSPGSLLDYLAPDQHHWTPSGAAAYARQRLAQTAVDGVARVVEPGAPNGAAVAIVVSVSSPLGRRYFSVDYLVSSIALDRAIASTASAPGATVYLADGLGNLLVSSPSSNAVSLATENRPVSKALSAAARGRSVTLRSGAMLVAGIVPGTSWVLAITEPRPRSAATTSWAGRAPWVVSGMLVLAAVAVILLFRRSVADRRRLQRLSVALDQETHTDRVTGLYNRRNLTECLQRAAAHADRHEMPLSVLMIDLDHLEELSHGSGRHAGDRALLALGETMRTTFRAGDAYGRWDGDKFLAILPASDVNAAHEVAERLRRRALVASAPDGSSCPLGLSIGCATGVDPEALVLLADEALHLANADGRGRVVHVPSEDGAGASGPATSTISDDAADWLRDAQLELTSRLSGEAPVVAGTSRTDTGAGAEPDGATG